MKNLKKNKAYLFDIDGTLTYSRQKMENAHTFSFLSWSNNKNIFLVTGSDYCKAIEQIPNSIIRRCKGIFTSMGNVYHENQKVIYENTLDLPDYIIDSLKSLLDSSACPEEYRSSKHFESRPGMLNFSICGRDVNDKQRELYNEWDCKNKERENIVHWFNKKYESEKLEACLGGEISIDIQPIGKDKRQSVEYLIGEGYNRFMFFGDRAYPGGNDWGVCEYIVKNNLGSYINVTGPNQTVAILSELV